MAIHTLDGAALLLDGRPPRSDAIYAVDLTHVNEGLVAKGASRVQGVLGADVLTYHQAVIDYATMSLFLHHSDTQPIDEANDPLASQLQRVRHDTLPWLISFSLGL